MTQKPSRASIVTQTTIALPLVIIVWLIIATLSHLTIGLLDSFRGLSDDPLQQIFRDVFTPGLGGFFAIQASSTWLQKANQKFVFLSFCLLTVLFTVGLPLNLIFTSYQTPDFPLREQILLVLGGVATLFGAWLVGKRFF